MSWLGGGGKTTITEYSGLQVQTTSSAVPIPIMYGVNVVTPNCIWYANFQAHAVKSGGGKGGGATTAYTYTCSIMLGVCEGPITAIGTCWQTTATPVTLASLGLSLYTGNTPQAAWPYLRTAAKWEDLSYPGIAYVCDSNYSLGSDASVGSTTLEVYGVLQSTGCNGHDADPAQVVYDFLTNPQYGCGFPATAISGASLFGGSGTSSYQAYCWALGLAFSPALTMQESALSTLGRWLQITNATAIWSDGLLKILPFGDTAITGNTWTWEPNSTVLYDLTDDDFLAASGDDPVKINRIDSFTAKNQLSVEIQSREDSYNTGPVVAFDQASINRFGLRIGSTVTAHEICEVGIGQTVAQLILQRGLYIRNTYAFKLGREFCLLEAMDLVSLTDAGLGLNKTVVRIVEIDEDDSGELTVTAEEYPQGVATATAYPTQAKSNNMPNSLVVPAAVSPPLLLEPPPSLTGNVAQLWVGASPIGGDPNWGGCVVWASLDGTSYAQIAQITAAAQQGVLTAALPAYAGANPDATDTLAVNLAECLGALSSIPTASAAAAASNLAYVNGEFLSFTNATLTAVNQYNLTGLYRGLYGSTAGLAGSGAGFCQLDSAFVKYAIPTADIGQTIYLKFQSYNIYNAALEDISTCAAYTYVVQGTGVLGPVASALALGTAMDFSHVASDAIAQSDDWGSISSAVISVIDLGNCTS